MKTTVGILFVLAGLAIRLPRALALLSWSGVVVTVIFINRAPDRGHYPIARGDAPRRPARRGGRDIVVQPRRGKRR